MAASPNWKVYDTYDHYQAACKEPEAALALAQFYGDGATIRFGHIFIVWTEGMETHPANDSYESAVVLMWTRIDQRNKSIG